MVVLPTEDPPPEHPAITAAKAAYARKGERVLSDPAYRASLPADWWQTDLAAIRALQERHATEDRLDPWKSSVEIDHADDYSQRFRFRRWPLERSFWLEHLPSVESNARRLDRFTACGSDAYVWQDPADDSLVLRSVTCKLRVCPACRRRYQFAAIARIRNLLADMQPRTWQFITLTIRHTSAPLGQQTAFLKAAFRKLRQRKLWRSSVAHGYAVLEVTYNAARDEWHPHLHVLARCRYVDWKDLRRDWIAVTGGSSVIDCGHVRNVGSACDYVAKYLAKPPRLLDLPAGPRLAEYYSAIQHARFLMPFGNPPKPPAKPALDTPRTLKPIAPLTQLHIQAKRGDMDAARVLRQLVHRYDAASQVTDPEHRHAIAEQAAQFDPTDPLTYPT